MAMSTPPQGMIKLYRFHNHLNHGDCFLPERHRYFWTEETVRGFAETPIYHRLFNTPRDQVDLIELEVDPSALYQSKDRIHAHSPQTVPEGFIGSIAPHEFLDGSAEEVFIPHPQNAVLTVEKVTPVSFLAKSG